MESRVRQLIARGEGLGLPLSAREVDVVLALMAGHVTRRRIARALHMTEATVNSHCNRIYAKAGVANLTEIALMVAGVVPCSPVLLPVRGRWRRVFYKIEE